MVFADIWQDHQLCCDMAAREEREMYGTQDVAGPIYPGSAKQAGSLVAEGPSEVRQQLEALNYNLDGLSKAVSMLEERLAWILLPDAPMPGQTRAEKTGPVTGLANDIRQLGESVVNCANRVNAIRLRVAL